MSKLETLKALPTPADVRENVRQLGQMLAETSERLDQTARQVQSLEQLPQLVADQVTEAMRALDPVLQMSEQVNQALQAFDRVNSVQRQSLEQLGQELTSQATAAMETRAASMDQTLQALASQVQSLKTTMASMLASSKGMQALPQALDSSARSAAKAMQSSAGELARQAQEVRPSVWLVLGQMLGAAMLGALLVAAGQAVLNKPAPASAEIQQRADQLSQLVRKSTPKVRELLNQNVSRPEK
jgi:ABC-type transporter Mla subunit MlaD